ncbi:MAG: STAS domain-containing protein [Chitinivibrionales bacterium]|nr:STAS domain-containing protein [Chitinivibrionales bacterium]
MGENAYTVGISEHGSYVLIALTGAFAGTGFGEFRETLGRLKEAPFDGSGHVVIDLSGATLLTSSCLEALYAARKQGEPAGREFVVIAPGEDMKELFQLTGFDRFFPMYDTVSAFLRERGLG